MRSVYKYPIEITDGDQVIRTNGEDASIRHVAMQNGALCVWVECEPNGTIIEKRVRVHGTGHPIEDNYLWRGTVQAGQFVWHVYERNS